MALTESDKKTINIVIDNEIKSAAPNLQLGVITCSVKVSPSDETVKKILDDSAKTNSLGLSVDSLKELSQIANFRALYKNLGKDPSRYRPSSEMLLRRIIQKKGLYFINNVVDLLNSVSISTRYPMGFYDTDQIKGFVTLRVGKTNESYPGIRKEDVNTGSLPVFADDLGPFGSPTSDSARTMVKNSTKNLTVILLAFSIDSQVELISAYEKTKDLLSKFASGKNYNFQVIR